MKILGIDPGKKTGVAILESPTELYTCGTWTNTPPYKILKQLDLDGVDLAVVENAYVGINSRSALSVARNIGRWQEALESRGIRVELVLASEWQALVLAVSSRTPREERKHLARVVVESIFKEELDEHSSDAVLLARYGYAAFSRRF